jgi:peroxiredoxin Q/BCP
MKRAALWVAITILMTATAGFSQLTANTNAVDNSPKVGDLAPDFALAQGTTSVPAANLKDLAGKKNVLLMFFPGAFTAGCTTEFTEAGKFHDQFTAMNIELVGISRDLRGAQAKFKETVGAKNGFVSDPELTVTTRYDAVSPNRTSKRYYFLIDDKGKIVWKSVSGQLVPTEKLLGDLKQVLQQSSN